jgi:MIP family channel proteins
MLSQIVYILPVPLERVIMSDTGLYGSSTSQNMFRACTAEAVGTFILVFPGTAVATEAILKLAIAGPAADSLMVALIFGFTLAVMVCVFGHISGCHLNPAVTLGLAISGKFPWKYVPGYIVAQIGGAIVASSFVWWIFGKPGRNKALLAVTQPSKGFSSMSVFAIEFVMTAILELAICSIATDERAEAATGIAIGFWLFIAVAVAGPISGGAINPARALGPMVIIWKFKDLPEYILGPVSGAMFAALLYTKFWVKGKEPSQAEDDKNEETN